MTPEEYVAALRRDGEALAAAAETGPLDAPVAACPGWTLSDLVRHTGAVHRDKAATVRLGGERPRNRPESGRTPTADWEVPSLPAPPEGADLVDWYREGLGDLVSLLGGLDPEAPAWSWAGDHRVGFWQRRMAHETLIHRYDAEAAVGAPQPLDPALAADGVDEVLAIFRSPSPPTAAGGTVHLHAIDGEGEWALGLVAGDLDVRRAHERADLAVRASASDLDLLLWGRAPLGGVERIGDAGRWDALLARLDTT